MVISVLKALLESGAAPALLYNCSAISTYNLANRRRTPHPTTTTLLLNHYFYLEKCTQTRYVVQSKAEKFSATKQNIYMYKILVVEDETVIRSALRRLLERNNYQVSEAGAVKEAIENFELSDFDLIISDLRLPTAPGTDLIKHAGEVPVLIMTSYASLRSAVDSMKSGAVDYIAKQIGRAHV